MDADGQRSGSTGKEETMEGNNAPLVRPELRSPRAAAIAGIAYALLMITGMALTTRVAMVKPQDVTREWLETWSGTTSVVLTLMPFAGIAFLWFTGVVRDWLGDREDRLFATIFLGSGIIQVLLLFLWSAVFGALMGTQAIAAVGLADDAVYVFGFALMHEIIANYTLRMAGLYMTAIGSLWLRTGTMPRWLTIGTFILALGFLVAAPRFREARFAFPAWVLVVSVYILVLNYRRTHEQESGEERGVGSKE
jgi:hypothetical protein